MHMRAHFPSHPLHVCTRPNQVDVAPLVPAEGLLLAEVHWRDVARGPHGAPAFAPSAAARAASAAFKTGTLYPHIHELHAQGGFDAWLARLQGPRSEAGGGGGGGGGGGASRHADVDFERLRRVAAAWELHKRQLTERRQAAQAAKASRAHAPLRGVEIGTSTAHGTYHPTKAPSSVPGAECSPMVDK